MVGHSAKSTGCWRRENAARLRPQCGGVDMGFMRKALASTQRSDSGRRLRGRSAAMAAPIRHLRAHLQSALAPADYQSDRVSLRRCMCILLLFSGGFWVGLAQWVARVRDLG